MVNNTSVLRLDGDRWTRHRFTGQENIAPLSIAADDAGRLWITVNAPTDPPSAGVGKLWVDDGTAAREVPIPVTEPGKDVATIDVALDGTLWLATAQHLYTARCD